MLELEFFYKLNQLNHIVFVLAVALQVRNCIKITDTLLKIYHLGINLFFWKLIDDNSNVLSVENHSAIGAKAPARSDRLDFVRKKRTYTKRLTRKIIQEVLDSDIHSVA